MKKSESCKQLGQLRITYFLEGGEEYTIRGFFPVEGTVPRDVILDSLARTSGEFFKRYAERWDEIEKQTGLTSKGYFHGEIIDTFAELVRHYAGFTAEKPEIPGGYLYFTDEAEAPGEDG